MPKLCTKCGKPINDGSKFCTSCGTPVEVERTQVNRFCHQCGNLLAPGAKFCDVCGKEALVPKKEEPKKIEEPATMDEIVIPVITDETFAGARELNREKFDGFESAAMPGAIPEAPAPPPAFSMDAAAPKAAAPAKPEPQPVQAPPPQRVTPESIHNSNPYAQYGARQTTGSPAQNYTRPQAAQPQSNNPYGNAPIPGQPIPSYDKHGNETKESMTVPIILAVIIAVILIADVVVFFGHGKKDKDTEDEVRNIPIIRMLEEG